MQSNCLWRFAREIDKPISNTRISNVESIRFLFRILCFLFYIININLNLLLHSGCIQSKRMGSLLYDKQLKYFLLHFTYYNMFNT